MSRGFTRLGLMAGGGELPWQVAHSLPREDVFVIPLAGFCDRDYSAFEHREVALGEFAKAIKTLRAQGCDAVCMCGYVTRPNFKALKMDAKGVMLLPRFLAAARKGDDAILRTLVEVFEENDFKVLGADEILDANSRSGRELGVAIADETRADIDKAVAIARTMGREDIGQGAVVAGGLVLAVEAYEGTQLMMERVAALPQEVRGKPGERLGVLAKMPKPIQERRMDIPTIGVETVRQCDAAGLAGIVLEREGGIVLDPEGVDAALKEAGLFLALVDPETDAD